jgi:hypothetical protein
VSIEEITLMTLNLTLITLITLTLITLITPNVLKEQDGDPCTPD